MDNHLIIIRTMLSVVIVYVAIIILSKTAAELDDNKNIEEMG